MNDNTFKQKAIRHGELMLVPVDSIPSEASKIFSGREYICAHSETGHHHVAVGDVSVFQSDGGLFLRVNRDSVLEHRKTFDFHAPKTLFKGVYQITIKKAYDYFTKRLERVRD